MICPTFLATLLQKHEMDVILQLSAVWVVIESFLG